MKANELMIGDWVYNTHNRQNEQVAEIGSGLVMLDYNDLYEYDEIEPIPLTAEILEVNGFGLNQAREEAPRYVWFGESNRNDTIVSVTFYDPPVHGVKALTKIDTDCSHGCGVNNVHNCDIEYVHELQHALRLCGIEKEIVVR